MTTKIDSPAKFIDRLFDWGSRILDCRKYVDLNKIFNTFIEVLLACTSSCFPGIDSMADDEDEDTQTEQNNKLKGRHTRVRCLRLTNVEHSKNCTCTRQLFSLSIHRRIIRIPQRID